MAPLTEVKQMATSLEVLHSDDSGSEADQTPRQFTSETRKVQNYQFEALLVHFKYAKFGILLTS